MFMANSYYSTEIFIKDAINKIFSNKFDKGILKKISELIKDFKYEDLVIEEQENSENQMFWSKKLKITELIVRVRNAVMPYFKKTITKANIGKWTTREYERFKEFAISDDMFFVDGVAGAYLIMAFAMREKTIKPDIAVINLYKICSDIPPLILGVAPSKEEIAKRDFEIRDMYLPMKWLTKGKYSMEFVKNKMHEYKAELESRNFDEEVYKKTKMRLII